MSNGYIYVKVRILKSNAIIWYNKICNTKQLTPQSIHIKEMEYIRMEYVTKQMLLIYIVHFLNK